MVGVANLLVALCLAVVGGVAQENNKLPLGNSIISQDESSNMTAVNLGGFFKGKKKTYIPLRRGKGANKFVGYIGEIEVGTPIKRVDPMRYRQGKPGNVYDVYFDTQSSITWMFDDSTAPPPLGKERPPISRPWRDSTIDDLTVASKYDCFQSRTAKKCDQETGRCIFVQTYPNGARVSGDTIQENLKVGHYNLRKKKIGLVSVVNDEVDGMETYDGSVGLGLSDWTTNGLSYIFNTEKTKMTFAFYISNSMESGEITLGGYNEKLLKEDTKVEYIMAMKVYRAGTFNGVTLNFNGGMRYVWGVDFQMQISDTVKKETKALIETTSPYGLIVPDDEAMDDVATDMKHGVVWDRNTKQLSIDCDERDDVPPLLLMHTLMKMTFSFGGREVFPDELKEENGRCIGFFTVRDNSHGLGGDDKWWGIGQYFIKKYYMVFEIPAARETKAYPRIGFAPTHDGIVVSDDKKTKKNGVDEKPKKKKKTKKAKKTKKTKNENSRGGGEGSSAEFNLPDFD